MDKTIFIDLFKRFDTGFNYRQQKKMRTKKISNETKTHVLSGFEEFLLGKALQIAMTELLKVNKKWSKELFSHLEDLTTKFPS